MSVQLPAFSSRLYLGLLRQALCDSFGWYFSFIFPVGVWVLSFVIARVFELNYIYCAVWCLLTAQIFCFFSYLYDELKVYINKAGEQLKIKEGNLEREKLEHQRIYETQLLEVETKEKKLRNLVNTTTPFNKTASMFADVETLIFKDCANYLKYKKHPARGSAKYIERELAVKYNETVKELKELRYKYDYILSSFPEISDLRSSIATSVTSNTSLMPMRAMASMRAKCSSWLMVGRC